MNDAKFARNIDKMCKLGDEIRNFTTKSECYSTEIDSLGEITLVVAKLYEKLLPLRNDNNATKAFYEAARPLWPDLQFWLDLATGERVAPDLTAYPTMTPEELARQLCSATPPSKTPTVETLTGRIEAWLQLEKQWDDNQEHLPGYSWDGAVDVENVHLEVKGCGYKAKMVIPIHAPFERYFALEMQKLVAFAERRNKDNERHASLLSIDDYYYPNACGAGIKDRFYPTGFTEVRNLPVVERELRSLIKPFMFYLTHNLLVFKSPIHEYEHILGNFQRAATWLDLELAQQKEWAGIWNEYLTKVER